MTIFRASSRLVFQITTEEHSLSFICKLSLSLLSHPSLPFPYMVVIPSPSFRFIHLFLLTLVNKDKAKISKCLLLICISVFAFELCSSQKFILHFSRPQDNSSPPLYILLRVTVVSKTKETPLGKQQVQGVPLQGLQGNNAQFRSPAQRQRHVNTI